MESRVQRLEADIATIKADLAVVKANYTTKADLAELESRLIKWMVGTALGLGASAITVTAITVTFVLNNAVQKAPASVAPIVITLPYPPQLPPTPPQPQRLR
jgi:hypothetical protein